MMMMILMTMTVVHFNYGDDDMLPCAILQEDAIILRSSDAE